MVPTFASQRTCLVWTMPSVYACGSAVSSVRIASVSAKPLLSPLLDWSWLMRDEPFAKPICYVNWLLPWEASQALVSRRRLHAQSAVIRCYACYVVLPSLLHLFLGCLGSMTGLGAKGANMELFFVIWSD